MTLRPAAWAVLALPLALVAGCALNPPPAQVAAAAPPQWFAPLPHQGAVADLRQWWSQWNDPLLAELVEAAQAASPDVAAAGARVGQARAARVQAGAALAPTLSAAGNVSRGPSQAGGIPPVLATSGQAGVQASWEIDLFGGVRAARDAAQARLDGADAAWHEARVAVAAEVAAQYVAQRACERQLEVARGDARSRAETSRLSDESARAGFTAPASAALARASAAEGASRATQQRAQCELGVKALVALTAIDEPELRRRLAAAPVAPPPPATLFDVERVPARVLSQRPDLYRAERDVAAASADAGSAQAARYPRLSLDGFVGRAAFRAGGSTFSFNTWTLGPLALSAPLFDGGRSAAEVEAARARYDEAVATYTGRVRQAVREVEEALVNLDSAASRAADAQTAADGYRASFAATEARYRNGLASLVELEDARRTLLAADNALIDLRRQRETAWVTLYRAVGGGWQRPDTDRMAATAAPAAR
ncbi:MAG: efflux transporter outer membrane subunit [Burkholderiaceae bacterium]|nr:efflux transporter outer membrane subunit [Burkholderiaceae bacterium]